MVGFLLFWLKQFFLNYLLQWVCRVAFILLSGVSAHNSFAELARTFWSGIPLDASFSAYIFILQLLLFPSLVFALHRVVLWSYSAIIALVYAGVLLLAFTDSALYRAWGSRINHDAIRFMKHPAEAFASMQLGQHIPELFVTIAAMAVVFLLFKTWYRSNAKAEYRKYALLIPVLILLAGLLARGGVGTVPVAASSVFKTNSMPLNITAINSGWNFTYFLFNNHKPENSEKYKEFKDREWEAWLARYCSSNLNTEAICKTEKPNVVLIVIESLNAYSSSLFGDGHMDNTPFIDSIARHGWYFTNCFSPVDRTPRAMAVVHSAFPGIPWGTILEEPVRAAKLPMLPATFTKQGYSSSFFYGGDLNFADIQSYLINAGYQNLFGIEKFGNTPRDKWGVRDEHLFKKVAQTLSGQKAPFFAGVLTLSSHEPYMVPDKYTRGLGSNREDFAYYFASVRYTDDCIRNFFAEVSNLPWFKNTLFVFCADHGRRVGLEKPENESLITHKIPLFVYGPALKQNYREKREDKICSQADIAQTLSTGILKIRTQLFPYSRNLADTARPASAFYYNSQGIGLIGPLGVFDYKNTNRSVTIESSPENLIPGYGNIAKAMQYALVLNYWKL